MEGVSWLPSNLLYYGCVHICERDVFMSNANRVNNRVYCRVMPGDAVYLKWYFCWMSVGNAEREKELVGRKESVISLTVVTRETEKLATEEVMICDVGIWITMAIMYTSWQCIIVAKIGTWSHRSIMATRIRCNILINVKMLCKMIFDRERECKSGWCMQSHEILSHAIKVDGWHFQKNTQTLPLMCVCVCGCRLVAILLLGTCIWFGKLF